MKHLFIVGAQRSGSTYLYQLLDEHPEVSMAHPVSPEPKFFMNKEKASKGIDYYKRSYFSDKKVNTVYLGEKSTSYIESADAANRIQTFFPEARILVILRDPVFRAYSNYRLSVANGFESLSFAEALAGEPERLKDTHFVTSVSPFAYRQRGHYMDYIENYLAVFDANNIKIIIFEELVNSINDIQALYGWLGINSELIPASLSKVVNPASDVDDRMHISKILGGLTVEYEGSIARLENFLGRQLKVWREQHHKLRSGVL